MEHGTTERSWTIRPLTEADIEAYLDIYLNSYPAYKTLDEECRAHYREKHLTELLGRIDVELAARLGVYFPFELEYCARKTLAKA